MEGVEIATNVAKLDPGNPRSGNRLIRDAAADGTLQTVVYQAGVGATPNAIQHWLGGMLGLGLKTIVLNAYASVVRHYVPGDDLILCGFSRGLTPGAPWRA